MDRRSCVRIYTRVRVHGTRRREEETNFWGAACTPESLCVVYIQARAMHACDCMRRLFIRLQESPTERAKKSENRRHSNPFSARVYVRRREEDYWDTHCHGDLLVYRHARTDLWKRAQHRRYLFFVRVVSVVSFLTTNFLFRTSFQSSGTLFFGLLFLRRRSCV